MKVYFTTSIVGKKMYLKNYTYIIQTLKKRGYTISGEHILDTSEAQIRSETREERISYQKKLENWIGSCDFMVVESSFPSISVGYEISLAMSFRKPVLILYAEGDAPSLLKHGWDERILCEKYTFNTLNSILDDFINYFEGACDSRFTFYITPRISAFLDKISIEEKIPKSVYLRKLIEREMK